MNRGGVGPGAAPDQRQMPQDEGTSPGRQDGGTSPGGFNPAGNEGQGPIPGFGGGGPQGREGGGAFGTGQAGPLRLFQTELSGQISWLLPFAAFACAGLLAGIRRRKPLTAKQKETLFWLAWLLPSRVFFSVAGFFHHSYLIMLAPPIAALAGAGWVELWNQYRDKEGWKRWLLPAGLLTATAFELYVLQTYQKQIGMGWSIGIGAAGIGLSLVLFLTAKKQKLSSIAAMAGMLVLLAAPLYWAATPLLYGVNDTLPQAGPNQQGFGQRQDMGGGPNSGINDKLLEYVTRNNTGETYLFAATDSHTAAPYIIETGKAVMAMGGFSGSDPILTVEKLQKMVANKEVKYFLISSGSGFGGRGGGGSSEVMDWIRANSTEVPKEEWQTTTNSSQGGPMGMENDRTLYKINQ
ncbi:MAG: mannosyltransferase YkcB-related protein, partial [Eubacteriales bacterium]